jgi:YidC/Oxa1 family membrane protein insertase
VNILDALATPVAWVLKTIHEGLSTFLPDGSGWAWGFSIVLLTVTVRIAIFPLFVKQVKSQRRMMEIAPKMKDLQAKHKGDRETLNVELMKLYKDHGTNPVSGCLPMILQLPIFFALFRVMNEFKPHFGADGEPFFKGKYGLSSELIEQGAHAKVFGAPISAAFTSNAKVLDALNGSAGPVKVLAVVLIVTMGLTTYITTRQMMARNGPIADPQQAQIQKIMLYVLPFSFAIFGFSFPIGVLLYWLTTNVWSVGQQRWVISRMPVIPPGGSLAKSTSKAGDKDAKSGKAAKTQPASGTATATAVLDGPAAGTQAKSGAAARSQQRPTGKAAGSRKNKKKKRR